MACLPSPPTRTSGGMQSPALAPRPTCPAPSMLPHPAPPQTTPPLQRVTRTYPHLPFAPHLRPNPAGLHAHTQPRMVYPLPSGPCSYLIYYPHAHTRSAPALRLLLAIATCSAHAHNDTPSHSHPRLPTLTPIPVPTLTPSPIPINTPYPPALRVALAAQRVLRVLHADGAAVAGGQENKGIKKEQSRIKWACIKCHDVLDRLWLKGRPGGLHADAAALFPDVRGWDQCRSCACITWVVTQNVKWSLPGNQ